MSSTNLPSFERPPVVETVLGVQFSEIPGFSNAHLGAFWRSLGDDWPRVEDAPPIEPAYERFSGESAWGVQPKFTLTNNPATRVRIKNRADDTMVQLQNGRLHLNWLGQGGAEYPRYKAVRPEFDRISTLFRVFLLEQGLGEPQPNQWEITYVNHIPKGSIWAQPEDLIKVLVGLPGAWKPLSNVRFEGFGGAWHYEIEPQRGRLHVNASLVSLGSEEIKEAMRLTLTARGPASDKSSLGEGLDLGRKAIVTTFKEITSADAHSYWGLAQ